MRWHNWQDRGAPHCVLLPCEMIHHDKFLKYCNFPWQIFEIMLTPPATSIAIHQENFKSIEIKHPWRASHHEPWNILDCFDPFVFRATCVIPVETWQRPSGFCLQLSFFLSGMSLANSRFQIWFSFNAIDTYVSCSINLICNGNISNHSSPHSVFGQGIISRDPEPRNVKIYL